VSKLTVHSLRFGFNCKLFRLIYFIVCHKTKSNIRT
jgi:hypothetical protein